ncbi:MAG: hypothetical protein F2667_03345 [Actinobacteria bacterium]|uniref:Unannotated protein n=1 Tax=freshwater metagenome TaxID=449393 RepID=A0A6J6PFB7_9ZZZZ|nr:hypothetical protein [Actinomycetota bacterium]
MAHAVETPRDSGPLQVDLPDLRGYAQLIDGLGFDLGTLQTQAETYCVDADFGKILEDLTSDYAALLPQLKELLGENEVLMKQYARALDIQVLDYERTDDGVAGSFGSDGIRGDTGTNTGGFAASSPIDWTASPYPSESSLPEVSFGFVFDRLAWALETFCNWDVRTEVTDWIAGDVVGLSTQAHCWQLIGQRLGDTDSSLSTGEIKIYDTWSGQAASAHASSMIGWSQALTSQSTGLADLGEHLRSLAAEAVNVAQMVVDCIRLAIDLITSAWALQYIPIYGQAKFIQKAWNAYKTASKATAYIRMLISALRVVKDYIVVLIDTLTPSMLPPKPMGV